MVTCVAARFPCSRWLTEGCTVCPNAPVVRAGRFPTRAASAFDAPPGGRDPGGGGGPGGAGGAGGTCLFPFPFAAPFPFRFFAGGEAAAASASHSDASPKSASAASRSSISFAFLLGGGGGCLLGAGAAAAGGAAALGFGLLCVVLVFRGTPSVCTGLVGGRGCAELFAVFVAFSAGAAAAAAAAFPSALMLSVVESTSPFFSEGAGGAAAVAAAAIPPSAFSAETAPIFLCSLITAALLLSGNLLRLVAAAFSRNRGAMQTLKPKKGKEAHTLHQKVKGETPHPTKPQGWKLSLPANQLSERDKGEYEEDANDTQ